RAALADERRLRARAERVDRAGDELLAGAALAGDQHRHVRARDARDELEDATHRLARGDDAVHLGRRRIAAAQCRELPLLILHPAREARAERGEAARGAALAAHALRGLEREAGEVREVAHERYVLTVERRGTEPVVDVEDAAARLAERDRDGEHRAQRER